MFRWFFPVRRALVRGLQLVVAALMGILVVDVVWQVLSRYVVPTPSAWTTEIATLLMLWISFLGASLTYLAKGHLGVDTLVKKLPPRGQRRMGIFVHVTIALFSFLVFVYGGGRLTYITLQSRELSPVLHLQRGFFLLAIPLGGVFMTLFAIEHTIKAFKTGSLLCERDLKATSSAPLGGQKDLSSKPQEEYS